MVLWAVHLTRNQWMPISRVSLSPIKGPRWFQKRMRA